MHRRNKSQKCVRMVENVFLWPFLCVFNFYHVCACIIAYCQSFPSAQMHSWASAPDFEPDHSFSTHVQLLSAIFSCFYLSPIVFTFSLSILCIFNHLYLFSTVLSQIWVLVLIFTYFLYHFWFLSFIICYIWPFSLIIHHPHPYSITVNHCNSFSTSLFIFSHFR